MKTLTLKEVKKRLYRRIRWYENIYWSIPIFIGEVRRYLFYEIPNYFFRMRDGVGPGDVHDLDIYIARIIVKGLQLQQKDPYNTLRCLHGKKSKYMFHTMIKGYKAYINHGNGTMDFKRTDGKLYKRAQKLFMLHHKELWS